MLWAFLLLTIGTGPARPAQPVSFGPGCPSFLCCYIAFIPPAACRSPANGSYSMEEVMGSAPEGC